MDCENVRGVRLPKLERLSPNQFKILKIAVEVRKFSAAELFNRSKIQFSDVYDVINSLTERGYFVKNGLYELSRELTLFAKIKEVECFEKPDFVRMNFDEKIEKNFEVEEVINLLGNFFEIKENKECWLENFKVEYELEKDKKEESN